MAAAKSISISTPVQMPVSHPSDQKGSSKKTLHHLVEPYTKAIHSKFQGIKDQYHQLQDRISNKFHTIKNKYKTGYDQKIDSTKQSTSYIKNQLVKRCSAPNLKPKLTDMFNRTKKGVMAFYTLGLIGSVCLAVPFAIVFSPAVGLIAFAIGATAGSGASAGFGAFLGCNYPIIKRFCDYIFQYKNNQTTS